MPCEIMEQIVSFILWIGYCHCPSVDGEAKNVVNIPKVALKFQLADRCFHERWVSDKEISRKHTGNGGLAYNSNEFRHDGVVHKGVLWTWFLCS